MPPGGRGVAERKSRARHHESRMLGPVGEGAISFSCNLHSQNGLALHSCLHVFEMCNNNSLAEIIADEDSCPESNWSHYETLLVSPVITSYTPDDRDVQRSCQAFLPQELETTKGPPENRVMSHNARGHSGTWGTTGFARSSSFHR